MKLGHIHIQEEELIYGAKMAWRNSNRCIGRLFSDKFNVIDAEMLLTKHRSYHQLLIAYYTGYK